MSHTAPPGNVCMNCSACVEGDIESEREQDYSEIRDDKESAMEMNDWGG